MRNLLEKQLWDSLFNKEVRESLLIFAHHFTFYMNSGKKQE